MRIAYKTLAVAAATAMVCSTGPAMALINEDGRGVVPAIADTFVGVKSAQSGREMGSFEQDGYTVYCIETGSDYPSSLSGAVTDNDPLAAFVLGEYGVPSRFGNAGNSARENDLTAAAVWYILGQDAGLQTGQSSWQRSGWNGSTHRGELEQRRAEILNEYNSGVLYEADASLRVDPGNRAGTAYVDFTRDGQAVDSQVVVTLTGDAEWEGGGQSQTVTLASDGTWSGRYVATGNGTVKVSARTVDDVRPSNTYTIYRNGGAQDVVVAGGRIPMEFSDPTEYDASAQAEPTIETVASAVGEHNETAPDGAFGFVTDVVRDTIEVTEGTPGSTIELQARLYWSADEPTESEDAPASAELVTDETLSLTLDDDGEGTITVDSDPTVRPGWYSWDVETDETEDNAAYDAGYGVPVETGRLALWSPQATTQTSDQLVSGPTTLTDTVLVSSGLPGATFNGSTTLYGPFESDPSDGGADLTTAPVVGTSAFSGTYDADGKATVESEPQEVTEAGYYVWAETIEAVEDRSHAFEQTEAQESETSVNIRPTIATQVNDQQVLPGHTITDRVEVGGIVNSVGGQEVTNTVTGTLYGPVAPIEVADLSASEWGSTSYNSVMVDGEWADTPVVTTCEGVDWTGAPVAAELPAMTVTAGDDGTVVLDAYGEYTIPDNDEALGCYSYSETLTSTIESDDEPIVVVHEVGDDAQTTVALKPGLSTQVSEQLVAPGAAITDDILVWGTGGTEFDMVARLYGMADPGENRGRDAINDAQWRRMISEGSVEVLGEQVLTVAGDGTYTTDPVTLPEDATGVATWYEEALFEGSESSTITTPYGVTTETTQAIKPVITTLAHHEYDYAGSLFTDTIWVSGTGGNSGVITGEVLGPIPGNDQGNGAYTCDNLDWTDAPVAGAIEPIAIEGDGEFVSSSIQTTTAGCYTFVESLTMDDNSAIVVNTEPGEATETNYFAEQDASGVGAAATDAGGDGIAAGDPVVTSSPWAVGTGLALLVGAVATGAVALRRRTQ